MLKELFENKNALLIGIDIGSYTVKAVLLEKVEEDIRVLQCAMESMPKSAMNERDLQDIEAVGKVLARLRKKFPKQYKKVAVAVSGSTVITKTVFMDANFNDDELATQIEIEADSLIPYPIEEVSIDFERLETNPSDPSKVNVLLSAARTESVEARVSAVDLAGLQASVVDVETYALARAATLCGYQLPDDYQDKVVGIIDLGAQVTLMCAIKNDKVLFTRDQTFGGDIYTKNIISFYNKSYEEAELAKLTLDLPPNYEYEVLAPFQTSVIQQVRRSVQIFTTSTSEDRIDYLVLSGGTAAVPGLKEVIEDELGIHCVIAHPLGKMDFTMADLAAHERKKLSMESAAYMIACGLAMRSFDACHI